MLYNRIVCAPSVNITFVVLRPPVSVLIQPTFEHPAKTHVDHNRPAQPVDASRCCSCWSDGVQLRQSSICRLAVHAHLAIVRRAGACHAGAASTVRVAANRQLPPATPQRTASRSDDVALCRSHRSSIRRRDQSLTSAGRRSDVRNWMTTRCRCT